MQAIVNFRTMRNGAFKWMRRGMRRGFWRVLIVRDPAGCTAVNSSNVVRVAYESPEGIDGVTEKSGYCIAGYKARAQQLAEQINAEMASAEAAPLAMGQGD